MRTSSTEGFIGLNKRFYKTALKKEILWLQRIWIRKLTTGQLGVVVGGTAVLMIFIFRLVLCGTRS